MNSGFANPLQKPLPNNMIISYLTLRKAVGWLGVSLVPILVLGTFLIDHKTQIKTSASAYYYSSMRDEMTGIICGISLFLISYHGYDWLDSLASKLSGLFALGIAFFPTSSTNDKCDVISIIHYLSAAAFFITLSIISIFLFTKSHYEFLTKQKIQRNWIYRLCGIIMLVSVSCIALDSISFLHQHFPFLKYTIVYETIALTSFGFSWLTKGEFILKDK
jgi:hypothetical protein